MIGIVADDITGANDIGIMFAKSSWQVDVYPYPFSHKKMGTFPPDVLIVDTNSRLDLFENAYNKVYESTKTLQSLGCEQFFNKTCSVFRGNIGAEFDAMLDALGSEFAVVVLGFPKNGRTTMHGQHYVHGKKLADSEFRHDPVHPMQHSDLVEILQAQTNRKVSIVDHEIVEQGSERLKQEINQKRSQCHYLIVDVKDQTSLQIIAEAIKEEKIICGASGIAEELAVVINKGDNHTRLVSIPPLEKGVLCAAGSLMPQTYNQVEAMKRRGLPVFEMKSPILFSQQKEAYLEELISRFVTLLNEGQDVLVHSSNTSDIVKETKQLGASLGFSNTEVSKIVSESLALVVDETLKRTSVNRLLLAGGETSASVCNRLGIEGLTVWKEIEPGLPSCISLNDPTRMLVLKSGSFGSTDFFAKAIDHLKEN
ncbi:four-carbon acid sugar kinase family protein [Neobacillus bataviensis]|uniref:four-carbon acid sugar kinase family protein n=1 Tax=Neobacillus bataviensis TaxID=220685 RepID=UPI001CBAC1EA|nr:four-carbon acid sugar kinase family protein [Neobacillus bataviensis]